MHATRFEAIGTNWQIDTAGPIGPDTRSRIDAIVESFDLTWSRFRVDSLVSRIARTPGEYRLPAEAPAMMALYRRLYDCTDGAVSPLVGRALEQWGYDAAYTLRPAASIAPIPAWNDAIGWDGETLSTVVPVVVDVGAAGKGYLVDLVSVALTRGGMPEHTIDASGDILHRGGRPLRIALEHPIDRQTAIGIARVGEGALCASATTRRSWPGAHHVIDAITGRPTTGVLATWVTAASGLVADGIATALFFVGADRLRPEFEFEYVRMLASGRVEASAGFDGELFT